MDEVRGVALRGIHEAKTNTASQLLLIGGRSGVGKSTVAAEIHRQLAERDVHHAWVEGDNLDMAYPVPWRQGHKLAEANLAAIWSNYRAVGYFRLIYVNTASVIAHAINSLTTAMGGNPIVHGVLLTSSDAAVEHRLVAREIGGGLAYAVERSREAAVELGACAPPGVMRLKTDGRPVNELAKEIIDSTGWSTADPTAPSS